MVDGGLWWCIACCGGIVVRTKFSHACSSGTFLAPLCLYHKSDRYDLKSDLPLVFSLMVSCQYLWCTLFEIPGSLLTQINQKEVTILLLGQTVFRVYCKL